MTPRPVSNQWIDLTQRLSDVTWEIMEAVRSHPHAQGADFTIVDPASKQKRPVQRIDFDVKRREHVGRLFGHLAGGFGLEDSDQFEQAVDATARLNDGYGFAESTDLGEYQRLRNTLQRGQIPESEAKSYIIYAHTMAKLAFFRHGQLVGGKIVPHTFVATQIIFQDEGKMADLYSDRTESLPVSKAQLFEDLVRLGTAAFDERGDLPMLRRIAYFDQQFAQELKDMTNPQRLGSLPPISQYIQRATGLEDVQMPAAYNPMNLFPQRKS